MELQPHQQRVVDEKSELDEKLEKLASFIQENPIFEKLEEEDKDLLLLQQSSMAEYSVILSKRIARF